ncbi:UDP-N-acetylglucosamine diphosphorylase/glucosamine-1-phosphate N-acetyltransferase [Candidatus Nitrososphaera evergladensis SR1]|uniref:UDP-N-acetylglucosamine diphosphorylase/glucosamine-1-phosphate N-acetyltransferase n=1 Tax=Candidatus Nitrososphaera evergladensis SR1 TaxID=1459636 RepID=A0A075MXS8_9ARCH|nr:putative sugar nucleotidyl transferase [Candidatus Nitrososphaera evergladensis]AIF84099.1 UDP-N-acetylglucosamine diphosphorylase/glucosamine-1-phosphate N-acetyltransferase [Candidatus Nitrososphaera evergladensis SR1]
MPSIALFEDHHWRNFSPLTLTKATFDLKVGARTFFEECTYAGNAPDALLVRRHLEKVTAERHDGCKVNDPGAFDADTIFVNGLLHPATLDLPRLSRVSHTFAITSANRLLVARLSKKSAEYLQKCVEAGKPASIKALAVEKSTDTQSAEGLLSEPWDLTRLLENALAMQTVAAEQQQSSETMQGIKVLGQNAVVTEGAAIEEGTVLDARNGGIYIGPGAYISQSRIVGPAYIGSQTQVKQFSIIEKSYVGRNCRVAGEIEHSIVSDYTNKAHDGFLGHSYVGEWVNLGAMTTTSDLKMTYGNIRIEGRNTGLDKLGSFFADMSKTSIGTLIYSGRRIGVSSHLHGLVSGDVPSFTIYGKGIGAKNVELELASAIETQRKVMPRRGQQMSKAYEQMIKDVFLSTAQERKKAGVRRAKFAI